MRTSRKKGGPEKLTKDCRSLDLTEHFPISQAQKQSNDEYYEVQKRRSVDFEAVKLQLVRLGYHILGTYYQFYTELRRNQRREREREKRRIRSSSSCVEGRQKN